MTVSSLELTFLNTDNQIQKSTGLQASRAIDCSHTELTRNKPTTSLKEIHCQQNCSPKMECLDRKISSGQRQIHILSLPKEPPPSCFILLLLFYIKMILKPLLFCRTQVKILVESNFLIFSSYIAKESNEGGR